MGYPSAIHPQYVSEQHSPDIKSSCPWQRASQESDVVVDGIVVVMVVVVVVVVVVVGTAVVDVVVVVVVVVVVELVVVGTVVVVVVVVVGGRQQESEVQSSTHLPSSAQNSFPSSHFSSGYPLAALQKQ